MLRVISGVLAIAVSLASAPSGLAQTLRGSTAAMELQNRVARDHDFTFLRTAAEVRRFIGLGLIVHLPGNANYELAAVSYPYARPAVKLFVERLAAQYRAACGEKLVVTSLTRPIANQPSNASTLSVHPAGMAVDFRVSNRSACRIWLERTLLSLDGAGVINAIRESSPPHYHVAVFPDPYSAYVDRLQGGSPPVAVAAVTVPELPSETPATTEVAAVQTAEEESSWDRYFVRAGDSLWGIARQYATTVEILQELNGLRGTRILAGQILMVPLGTLD